LSSKLTDAITQMYVTQLWLSLQAFLLIIQCCDIGRIYDFLETTTDAQCMHHGLTFVFLSIFLIWLAIQTFLLKL